MAEFKRDYKQFVAEIKKRNITCLVHFTETINLLSIVKEGHLLSRYRINEIDTESKDFIVQNDQIRLDTLQDYINLSIEFPNSFLFRRFRERQKEPFINWCVLKIRPIYIYKVGTLFSISNAASSFSRNAGIAGDLKKFQELFSETLTISYPSGYSRTLTRKHLKDCYPTDEQAEVLVKGEIPYSDVMQICFEDEESLISTKTAFTIEGLGTSKFVINKTLFGARQ